MAQHKGSTGQSIRENPDRFSEVTFEPLNPGSSVLNRCEAMGTRFEALLFGHDEQHLDAVAVAVTDEIIRLDGVLSRFDPRSEIARINREAVHAPARVDREVFELLEKCEEARRLTGGYFDITAFSGTAGGTFVEAPALQLDAEICTVRFTRPDVIIDLGGVGKGYALDRGREIMRRFGATCGLLHGGTSSVLAVGVPPDRNGWPVAVRHPMTPDAAPVAQVELVDRALSCSAVRHPGQRQSDVLNPLTGRALGGDAACVALAANATDAEIFSTALLAMGREQAKRSLELAPRHGLVAGWFEPGAGFTWI